MNYRSTKYITYLIDLLLLSRQAELEEDDVCDCHSAVDALILDLALILRSSASLLVYRICCRERG
jgi:hypothetical protein